MNILIYVLCGILTYGLSFHHWQIGWSNSSKVRYKSNMIYSIFLSCLGSFGLSWFLIYWLIIGRFYAKLGLKFK